MKDEFSILLDFGVLPRTKRGTMKRKRIEACRPVADPAKVRLEAIQLLRVEFDWFGYPAYPRQGRGNAGLIDIPFRMKNLALV